MESSDILMDQAVESAFNENQNKDHKLLLLDNENVILNVKKVISCVIGNRDSWPFREAVKESEAINYYEIIKKPMDLSKISQKLEDKSYSNFNELEDDFRLIVTNCELYNGQFNGFTTNAYAVWRLFRKQTKKYLNHDLSLEDKDAFLYPPRYSLTANKSTSSVGKRKKRKKQKKSSRFLALELLYNATQESIESTFQNFAFSPTSDNENKNDNFPKKYQFLEGQDENKTKKSTGFYNPEFASNYSYQDGFYTDKNRNENLEFKSLYEWNKQIDENGQTTILPEKAVIVKHSPVDSNWLTNFQNDQIHYKTVFNKFLHEEPHNGVLENGRLVLNKSSSNCKESKAKKCKETTKRKDNHLKKRAKNSESLDEVKNEEEHDLSRQDSNKRLVIKLSKLNNWDSAKLHQESGSEPDSSSDSLSSCSSDSDN